MTIGQAIHAGKQVYHTASKLYSHGQAAYKGYKRLRSASTSARTNTVYKKRALPGYFKPTMSVPGHTNLNIHHRFKGHKLTNKDKIVLSDVQPSIQYYRGSGRQSCLNGNQATDFYGHATRDAWKAWITDVIPDSAVNYDLPGIVLSNESVFMFTNNNTATVLVKLDFITCSKSNSEGPISLWQYGASNISGGNIQNCNLWFESMHDAKTMWKNFRKNGKSKKFYLGPGETFKLHLHSSPNKKLTHGYFAYSNEVYLAHFSEGCLMTICGGQVASICDSGGVHTDSTTAACTVDYIYERRVTIKGFPMPKEAYPSITFTGSLAQTAPAGGSIKVITEDTDDIEVEASAGT